MGVALKIRFRGRKKDLQHYWTPVVLELWPVGISKPLRFAAEDFNRDIQDEENKPSCFFRIPGLVAGQYSLNILEFHTGHPIIQGRRLELKGKEVEFTLAKDYPASRQPNTFGMDLVADAPFRLERSHPYLPVIILAKDIKAGQIRINSIELYDYTSAEKPRKRLSEDALYCVLDAEGNAVEKDGRPAFLRCDLGETYETVNTSPWYRIILLRKDGMKATKGTYWGYKDVQYLQYMVHIRYEGIFSHGKQFVLRTRLPDSDLPRVSDWYYGDAHCHSEYTWNPYEYGGPLPMTAEVAKAIGLSWVTVTDHSYCLGHPKTPAEKEEGNRWRSYQRAIKETNDRHRDVLLLGAEEITVRSHFAGLHLLSFGNPFVEDKHPLGFGSLEMQEVLDRVRQGTETGRGFVYAAHPASSGYTWEAEDYRVAADAKYDKIFLGLQLFNEKILYQHTTESSMDRDFLNPFALLDEACREKNWSKELEEGVQNHWVERFLLPSLREYEEKRVLRKFFILGGSDAHMDFNCAFRPHPAFLIHYLNDNAFGKVRTLAYVPEASGQPLTAESLCQALRNGHTVVTDGPVALFSLAPAGEARKYGPGDTVLLPPGTALELSLEWKSTSEFGSLRTINLICGTTRGERDITSRVPLPACGSKGYGLAGSFAHLFPDWQDLPCYLRLEATSGVEPKTGGALFRCVTNPIWILTA